jgi:hypothetical protein
VTDAFEKLGDKITLAHSVVIMQQIAQAMEHLTSQQEIPHRGLAGRKALVFVFDQTNVLKTSVKLSDDLSSLFSSGDLSTGDKLIRILGFPTEERMIAHVSSGCSLGPHQQLLVGAYC